MTEQIRGNAAKKKRLQGSGKNIKNPTRKSTHCNSSPSSVFLLDDPWDCRESVTSFHSVVGTPNDDICSPKRNSLVGNGATPVEANENTAGPCCSGGVTDGSIQEIPFEPGICCAGVTNDSSSSGGGGTLSASKSSSSNNNNNYNNNSNNNQSTDSCGVCSSDKGLVLREGSCAECNKLTTTENTTASGGKEDGCQTQNKATPNFSQVEDDGSYSCQYSCNAISKANTPQTPNSTLSCQQCSIRQVTISPTNKCDVQQQQQQQQIATDKCGTAAGAESTSRTTIQPSISVQPSVCSQCNSSPSSNTTRSSTCQECEASGGGGGLSNSSSKSPNVEGSALKESYSNESLSNCPKCGAKIGESPQTMMPRSASSTTCSNGQSAAVDLAPPPPPSSSPPQGSTRSMSSNFCPECLSKSSDQTNQDSCANMITPESKTTTTSECHSECIPPNADDEKRGIDEMINEGSPPITGKGQQICDRRSSSLVQQSACRPCNEEELQPVQQQPSNYSCKYKCQGTTSSLFEDDEDEKCNETSWDKDLTEQATSAPTTAAAPTLDQQQQNESVTTKGTKKPIDDEDTLTGKIMRKSSLTKNEQGAPRNEAGAPKKIFKSSITVPGFIKKPGPGRMPVSARMPKKLPPATDSTLVSQNQDSRPMRGSREIGKSRCGRGFRVTNFNAQPMTHRCTQTEVLRKKYNEELKEKLRSHENRKPPFR